MTLPETTLIPPKKDREAQPAFAIGKVEALRRIDQKKPGCETFKGLCVDCEHRHQCVLSHTPGGVWNCNEYS